jgi:hypothetical protein
MMLPFFGNTQLIVVTGNIINEKTGFEIGNVNIFESLSGIGTITNVSGFFSLMLKPGNAEFVITHEGYKDLSKKMVLSADTTLTLSLVPKVNTKSKHKDSEHQKTAEKVDDRIK